MILSFEFSIPKNTSALTPVKQIFDMGVNASFLKGIRVLIPEGHKGLARLRVSIAGTPILPAQGSGSPWVRGENNEIAVPLALRVFGPPYLLICEGYNEDSFLPHTFVITVES